MTDPNRLADSATSSAYVAQLEAIRDAALQASAAIKIAVQDERISPDGTLARYGKKLDEAVSRATPGPYYEAVSKGAQALDNAISDDSIVWVAFPELPDGILWSTHRALAHIVLRAVGWSPDSAETPDRRLANALMLIRDGSYDVTGTAIHEAEGRDPMTIAADVLKDVGI